ACLSTKVCHRPSRGSRGTGGIPEERAAGRARSGALDAAGDRGGGTREPRLLAAALLRRARLRLLSPQTNRVVRLGSRDLNSVWAWLACYQVACGSGDFAGGAPRGANTSTIAAPATTSIRPAI